MWYEETNIGKLQPNVMGPQDFNGPHYAQTIELITWERYKMCKLFATCKTSLKICLILFISDCSPHWIYFQSFSLSLWIHKLATYTYIYIYYIFIGPINILYLFYLSDLMIFCDKSSMNQTLWLLFLDDSCDSWSRFQIGNQTENIKSKLAKFPIFSKEKKSLDYYWRAVNINLETYKRDKLKSPWSSSGKCF